jgi:predicted CXXCH cytochrome family protein
MGIMALSGHAFAKATCFQCHKEADFSKKTVHRPVAEGQCGLCHNPHVARFEGLLQQSGADLCYKCLGGKGPDERTPVRQLFRLS